MVTDPLHPSVLQRLWRDGFRDMLGEVVDAFLLLDDIDLERI